MGTEDGDGGGSLLEGAEGVGEGEDQEGGEISSFDHWLDRITESADRYFSDHLYESRSHDSQELSDVLP